MRIQQPLEVFETGISDRLHYIPSQKFITRLVHVKISKVTVAVL
jgi:hypothetical protein